MRHEVSLEDFLAPISAAAGRTVPAERIEGLDVAAMVPPHGTETLRMEDLTERFIQESLAIDAGVHRCDGASAAAMIATVVERCGGGVVLCADEEVFGEWKVLDALRGASCVAEAAPWYSGRSRDELVSQAARADIGVTLAAAAIADTGTIVQPCTPGSGRSISLLPKIHIAVVRASTIVPTMLDVLKGMDGARALLPSQMCFISGSSSTSDIELVRVVGVHGPMALHYVIVED